MGIRNAGDLVMSADGRAIANFVLDVCEAEGRPVSNLALQKIVYFCHVWSLVKLGKPLVGQRFEAWQFGPVLQYVYREFKEFERDPINTRAKRMNPHTGMREVVEYSFEEDVEEFLRKVIKAYSRISPGNLVDLSHVAGGPWDLVWNHSGRVNPGMTIDNESIVKYYTAQPQSPSLE